MDTKDKLIERQKELLDIFEDWLEIDYDDEGGYQKVRRLKSEIAVLDKQVEEQESKLKGWITIFENNKAKYKMPLPVYLEDEGEFDLFVNQKITRKNIAQLFNIPIELIIKIKPNNPKS